MPNFLDVPLDIKSYVFGYLRNHEDQQAVCRTCKDFHAIMLKQIYQTITLPDNLPMSKLSTLLSVDNPGVKYIRHVRVFSGKRRTCGNRTKSPDDMLHLLANQLPRDRLLTFDFNSVKHVDADILDTFHRRQRHLCTLRYGVFGRKTDVNLDRNRITTLQLLVGDNWGLEHAHELFLTTSGVRNLELHLDLEDLCTSLPSNHSVKDALSQKSAEVIVQLTVPPGVDGQQSVLPLKRLSALRLHGVNLSVAASALRDSVELQGLEELSLQNCEDELSLLKIMTGEDGNTRVALRRLEIMRIESTPSGHDGTHVLDKFLASFDTLESLIVHAPKSYDLKPDYQSIVPHKVHLRSLYLHFDLHDEVILYSHQVRQPVKYLPELDKLEQVAVDFHDVYLPCWIEDVEVTDLLRACAKLESLRTLRILRLPQWDAQDLGDEHVNCQYVTAQLKYSAKRVFEEISQLKVLSFGMRGASVNYGIEDGAWEQETYVRADVKDIGGRMSVEAIRVDDRDDRELEPLAEILDVDASDPDVLFQKYGHW